MVREHDGTDALEIRHLTQEIRADDRVRAHLGPFLVAEPRRLSEDVLRDADLSDVVEERAELHGRHLVRPEPQGSRDRDRVLHRGRRVTVRMAVLRRERSEERGDDRDVRLLET